MGSRAYLHLGTLQLGCTNREVDPTVLMLFSEKDKSSCKVLVDEDGEILESSEKSTDSQDMVDQEDLFKFETCYSAPLYIIKDRLDAMGYSINSIKKTFYADLRLEIEEMQLRLTQSPYVETLPMRELLERELKVLSSITFESWLNGIRFIIANNLHPDIDYWHYRDTPKPGLENAPELVAFLLGSFPGDGSLWFPSYDFRMLLRAIAEITDLDQELIYDISELVNDEYIDPDEDLCAWARRMTVDDFMINSKILVLTEGSTDVITISESMSLLYPYLIDFYSFMDFTNSRASGGAASLVQTLKSFHGAGVANRIIAIFDNDTAAKAALRSFRGVILPPNIKILHYPELQFAKSYPTLGPHGTMEIDVNGMAASIEMYFGTDVLLNTSGNFMAVQWKGFDEATNQYQGELLNKSELLNKFKEKLAKAKCDPSIIPEQDWSGMRLVIDQIRTAFQEPNPNGSVRDI